MRRHRQTHKNFLIDEMTKVQNKTVLRLSPYHCELNPIELVWAQVEGEVARHNTTIKIADVKNLFTSAIEHVT